MLKICFQLLQICTPKHQKIDIIRNKVIYVLLEQIRSSSISVLFFFSCVAFALGSTLLSALLFTLLSILLFTLLSTLLSALVFSL